MKVARFLVSLVVVALIVAGIAAPTPAQAAITQSCKPNPNSTRPWVTYLTGKGVKVCVLKDSSGNPVSYMQWVDLSAGARIRNAYELNGTGSATNPDFRKRKIENWWTWAQGNLSSPAGAQFSAVNGAFFSLAEENSSITTLSFPLKSGFQLITVGGDTNTQAKRVFGLTSGGAGAFLRNYGTNSKDWTTVSNELSGFQDANIGYDPNYRFDPDANARTWVGIRDADGNGVFESVLILASKSATHDQALSYLRDDFYTVANVQMDSGTSTQFNIRGTNVINSKACAIFLCRNVPHAFIVYEAP